MASSRPRPPGSPPETGAAAGVLPIPRGGPTAPDGPLPVATPPRRRGAGLARRHAVFLVLAAFGLAARVVVVVTYRPALVYLGDSAAYLDQARNRLWPGDWRPSGYPMFLRLIGGHAHLTWLVVVQHLLTFAAAAAVYAVALRALRREDGSATQRRRPPAAPKGHHRAARGTRLIARHSSGSTCPRAGRPWLAALVAAPAMLSPWVLDLGQFILADSLFAALVTTGAVVLARPGRPRVASCLAGGLLLGTAVTIRTAGYGPLAASGAVIAVAALRTLRWRRAAAVFAAFAAAAAVPLLGYSAWSAANGGAFSVSAHSGFFLYGRVAPFADCSVLSRADLRSLCDPRPVAQRPQPDVYLWSDEAPLRDGDDDIPPGREELAGEFAAEVIRAEPWMVARTTAAYLAGYFSPVRHENAKTSRAGTWELPDRLTNVLPEEDPHHFDGYYVATELDGGLAPVLGGYSRLAYAPMPLVGAGILAGLLASVVAWRRGRPGPPRLFWLATGAGMSVLAIGALTAGFDYRYLASVVALLGAAAVVGAASLARALRHQRL